MNSDVVVHEEINSENFPVKCISGIKRDHHIFYQVHWLPSWEREDCLIGCEDLVDLFKYQQKNEVYGQCASVRVYQDGNDNDNDNDRVGLPPAARSGSSLQDTHVSSSSFPCIKKKKSSGSYSQKKTHGNLPEWTNEGEMQNSCGSVQNIIGVFEGKDDCTYYRVEWTPTWEMEENLIGCDSLIKQFFELELKMDIPSALLGEDGLIRAGARCHAFEIKQEPPSPPPADNPFFDTTDDSLATDASEQLKTLRFQYMTLQKDFEEYGTEREAVIRNLEEKCDDLQEKVDTYEIQTGNEVKTLTKKKQVIEGNFHNYKKEKEDEIEILLERNKAAREKYAKYKIESSQAIEMLQKKYNEIRQELAVSKTERDSDYRILMEREQEVRDNFDKYKIESAYNNDVLRKQCDDLQLKLDQSKRDKAFEVKLLTEKNDETREKFESYKIDKEKENAMMSKKVEDHKMWLENLKKQKENEVKLLAKRVEERRDSFEKYKVQKESEIAAHVKKMEEIREKFDTYKNQKEAEVSQLQKSKEERLEWFDSCKSANEADLTAMKKKYEELNDAFEHYKRKKETKIDILEKKYDELTNRLQEYKIEKQSEIELLNKKFHAANEQMCNYKEEKESEFFTLKKKTGDILSRYELEKAEKEKENGMLLRKNAEMKERFDSYKTDKDNEMLVLVNKTKELEDKFQRFEKDKEREIRQLSKQVGSKSWIHGVKMEDLDIDDTVWQDQGNVDFKTKEYKPSIDIFAQNEDLEGTSSHTGQKEIQVEVLLKKNEDQRKEYEVYKGEAKVQIGKLLLKIENMKTKFDGEVGLILKRNETLQTKINELKEEKEGEYTALAKKNDTLEASFKELKAEKEGEHTGLLNKVTSLLTQVRSNEEEIHNLTEENADLKLQNGGVKKKLKRCEDEKENEISTITEEYGNLRKKFKAYKTEAVTENALLAEKIMNLKEKYKNYKKEQENDIDLLLKKIENQKEKYEKLEDKSEEEISALTEKVQELTQRIDDLKKEKEQEIKTYVQEISQRNEDLKKEKEQEIKTYLKKVQDLTQKIDEKEQEIKTYVKKVQELTQRIDDYKKEKEQEIKTYLKKVQEITQGNDEFRKEKEQEFKTYVKKHEEMKENLCKRDEEEKSRAVTKQCEEAKAEFEKYRKLKSTEIKNLYYWVHRKSTELNETKTELAAVKLKMNYILENADMQGINSIVLTDISSINTVPPKNTSKPDIIEIPDDVPKFNSCEIFGEYFSEDIVSLKGALKDKIVRIETMKDDIKELAASLNIVIEQRQRRAEEGQREVLLTKIKREVNNYDYDYSESTLISDNEDEEVFPYYQGTSETLGEMYADVVKKVEASKRLSDYYKFIYAQQLHTFKKVLNEKDEMIRSLEKNNEDNEYHIRVQNSLMRVQELEKPVEKPDPEKSFGMHDLMPTVESRPEVKPSTSTREDDDISLDNDNADESDKDNDADPSIKYKATGTASFFTKQQMSLLFNKKNNKIPVEETKVPYLRLHLKVTRGRHTACDSCGEKCSRGVYLKGDMKLRMSKNPLKGNECVKCFKRDYKRARQNSPVQTVDFRYEQKYEEWVNERRSNSPSKNNKLRDNDSDGCYRDNKELSPRSFNPHRTFTTHRDQNPIDVSDEKSSAYQSCDKQFNHSSNMKSHMLTHDPNTVCDKSESDENITFPCPECKKTLSWDSVLDGFLNLDTEEKYFKCHHCDLKFSPSQESEPEENPTVEIKNEEKHIELEIPDKGNRCCLCNLQFDNPDGLKDHNRRIHALSSKDYWDHFKPHKDEVDVISVPDNSGVVDYRAGTCPPSNPNRIVDYNDNKEKRPAFEYARRRSPFEPNWNMRYNPMNNPSDRPYFSNNWQGSNWCNRNDSSDSEMRPGPGPTRTSYNKHHASSNARGGSVVPRKNLYCYTCGKQFRFFHNLKIHARMHHAKSDS